MEERLRLGFEGSQKKTARRIYYTREDGIAFAQSQLDWIEAISLNFPRFISLSLSLPSVVSHAAACIEWGGTAISTLGLRPLKRERERETIDFYQRGVHWYWQQCHYFLSKVSREFKCELSYINGVFFVFESVAYCQLITCLQGNPNFFFLF